MNPESYPDLLVLRPAVQHYAWGDFRFIPDILGLDCPEDQPYAELWIGAHPSLPSKAVVEGKAVDLDRLLEAHGEAILGPREAARFGGWPYLLKVLSAAKPLSIQVHPTKAQAEEGFARENSAGVPLAAPYRNYKDANHKPELFVALTDFYALRGFRPLEEIADVLESTPELRDLAAGFDPTPEGLRGLYERFMTLAQEQVDALLTPLLVRLAGENRETPFPEDDPRCWVLLADREFSRGGHRDRGLFSIYLLNLIHLRPGQALYLPSGILHTYLRGAGIEIMASSDNVLRCGLTPKHVDVLEVLKTVRFAGERPEIIEADEVPGTAEWAYRTPAGEFELRRVEVTPAGAHRRGPDHGAEILFVVALETPAVVTVSSGRRKLELGRGGVCLIPRALEYTAEATGAATIFKASVPAVSAGPPALRFRGSTAPEGDRGSSC